MRSIDNAFYHSTAWKKTRAEFVKSRKGLCEDCLQRGLYTPGRVVHHVVPLTEENVTDPNVTLSWNNLRLLCQDCHAAVHKSHGKRISFDQDGNVIEHSPPVI